MELVCQLDFLVTGKLFDVCRIKKGEPIFIVTLNSSVGKGTCISCKSCAEKYKTEPFFISSREATEIEKTEIYGC